MPSRVRDLDQLQEHDPEASRRKLALVVIALCATVGLAFAFGFIVTRAAEGGEGARDPLERLDRLAAASRKKSAAQHKAAVDTAKLTFEHSLLEAEERPEVLAALAAASREEAQLAHHGGELELGSPPAEPVVRRGSVPAALTVGTAQDHFDWSRKHDQLVDTALPEPTGPRAPAGHDGEYTLQIISYDARSAAETFANNLRARGHEAFIITGEVEGRGRSYRVRIGPFKTRQSAESYRKDFEARERMSPILIRRPKSHLTPDERT